MFASEGAEEVVPLPVTSELETCDDPDGYYKAVIGESIRNYKVISVLGRGVFGSVVKAVNVDTQTEVAIKIVRSRDIYRVSGERERNVLKLLNDGDPLSTRLDETHVDRQAIRHQGAGHLRPHEASLHRSRSSRHEPEGDTQQIRKEHRTQSSGGATLRQAALCRIALSEEESCGARGS